MTCAWARSPGVDDTVFDERTGNSLWTALEYPVVKDYVDQLRQYGRLITDEKGIRFAREDIAKVFISMNWHEQPEEAAPVEPVPVELGRPATASV